MFKTSGLRSSLVVITLSVLSGVSFFPRCAFASPDWIALNEAYPPYNFAALFTGGFGCIVATVVRSDTVQVNNANPPRVVIDIHEVLRGSGETGLHAAIWAPYKRERRCFEADSVAYHKWAQTKLEGPEVGGKYILLTSSTKNDTIVIAPYGRYPFTEERRMRAIDVIKIVNERTKNPTLWQARQDSIEAEDVRAWASRRNEASMSDLCERTPEIFVASATEFWGEENGIVVGLRPTRILKSSVPKKTSVKPNQMLTIWLPHEADMAADALYQDLSAFVVFAKPATSTQGLSGKKIGFFLVDTDFGIWPGTPDVIARVERALHSK